MYAYIRLSPKFFPFLNVTRNFQIKERFQSSSFILFEKNHESQINLLFNVPKMEELLVNIRHLILWEFKSKKHYKNIKVNF